MCMCTVPACWCLIQRATEKTVGASSGQSAAATVPAATASLSVAQNLHLIHDCQLFSQQV